jgi:ribose 5-phosphate isomerase RpiB
MKIAVLSETSAADKNKDIISALEGRGFDIVNAGMKNKDEKPELQYNHTGLMAAILLNLGRVDLVIGGCGTGQGFLNSAMQYPGVFCGHILTPLDGWLFTQINGGNCISLALNQGYGWAGDVNLRFIFDQMFSVESGCGYPAHRKEPQAESREILKAISEIAHTSFAQIIKSLPDEVIVPVLKYPGFRKLIEVEKIRDSSLKDAFKERLTRI